MKDEDWIEAIGSAHCCDCRFFVEVERLNDEDCTVRGECKKLPPTVIHGTTGDTGTWPIIEGGDWCGEFELTPNARRAFEAERLERWNGRLK